MQRRKDMEKAAAKLILNHQTLAIAESVTAGLIQHLFSNIQGAASFFEGGITAYNINQKCTHLFIDPTHAIECNCVSRRVAEEMALGVSRSFNTDWGFAITGYASPVPELKINSLHAWYALSFAGTVILSDILNAPNGDPQQVQEFYAKCALEIMSAHWSKLPAL